MTTDPQDRRDRSSAAPQASGSAGGSQRSRAPRADALRNRRAIADAAMIVLAERPGASMGEIASACELGRATLYRHFANRQELVEEIQTQALEAGAEALEAAALEEGDPLEALRRAIAALVGVGNRYRLLAQEPSVDPRVLQRQAAVAGRLVALVQRGQRQGALRGDVEASWVVGALASLLVLALRQMADAQVSHEQAAELVATTLLKGLATPPAKPASDR